jgi:hypothetical protein
VNLSHCADCGASDQAVELWILAADVGDGAALDVLCFTCLHRRAYRAELRRRLATGRGRSKPQINSASNIDSEMHP